MKYCTNCCIIKNKEEFGRDKQKCDGLNQYCKACIRVRSRSQRESNFDYGREYFPEYRNKNRERLREQGRKRLFENREKYAEIGKKSYYKHQKEIAQRRAIKRRTPELVKKNRERAAEWRRRTGSAIKYVTRWRKDNPQKAAIHSMVMWAVRAGVLTRKENCEECELKCKTQGHREDYSRPLEVIWLCPLCHGKRHRTYR